ncbi:hypothetical protein lerEdw1_010946, partial [Lerista edwardsae]
MKKEEEEPRVLDWQQSEGSENLPVASSGCCDVIIKKEEDEQPPWTLDAGRPLQSAGCRTAQSGTADHRVVEENEIASDSSTGFPDVIVKLEQEETAPNVPSYQELGGHESIP